MVNKLKINGKVLNKLHISDDFMYKTAEIGVETVDVIGNTRKIFKRVIKEGTDLVVPVIYRNRWYNNVPKTYEEIVEELVEDLGIGSGEILEIGFTDSSYHLRGYFVGSLELGTSHKEPLSVSMDLTFKLSEPYKYSNELKTKEVGNSVSVVNGKDIVSPVFRLTATKSSQYLRLYNSKTSETLLIGEDEISDTKQQKIRTYTINGLTNLTNESTHGNNLYYEDGILKPEFDNLGGTLRYRHNLGGALNDFGQVITFRTMGVEPGQRSDSFIHYYDARGNVVISLEMVVDPNTSNPNLRSKAHVVLRVRNEQGTGMVTLREFSGDDYNNVFDDADLSVRVVRVGNKISYKTWKHSRRDGSLTGRNTMSWKGLSNEPITHFKIGFVKQRNKPTSELGIVRLEVDEIVNGSSTHYDIVEEGDVIEVNNDIKLVTRNGEPIMDLKDIYSEYITLGKGSNKIDIRPTGTYEGVIEYRERKL